MSDLTSRVAELSNRFSGRVLLPDNPAWDAARRVHNGFVDKRAALAAQCRGSVDQLERVGVIGIIPGLVAAVLLGEGGKGFGVGDDEVDAGTILW